MYHYSIGPYTFVSRVESSYSNAITTGINRDGRNWEGTFADPYACGEASYQFTVGMLEAGTILISSIQLSNLD